MLVERIEIQALIPDRLAGADFQITGDGGQSLGMAADQIETGTGRGETAGSRLSDGRCSAENQDITHMMDLAKRQRGMGRTNIGP